jgi:hypothetical protein
LLLLARARLHLRLTARLRQQIAMERIVAIVEQAARRLTAFAGTAALRLVVRQIGNDDTSETAMPGLRAGQRRVNQLHCHRAALWIAGSSPAMTH